MRSEHTAVRDSLTDEVHRSIFDTETRQKKKQSKNVYEL